MSFERESAIYLELSRSLINLKKQHQFNLYYQQFYFDYYDKLKDEFQFDSDEELGEIDRVEFDDILAQIPVDYTVLIMDEGKQSIMSLLNLFYAFHAVDYFKSKIDDRNFLDLINHRELKKREIIEKVTFSEGVNNLLDFNQINSNSVNEAEYLMLNEVVDLCAEAKSLLEELKTMIEGVQQWASIDMLGGVPFSVGIRKWHLDKVFTIANMIQVKMLLLPIEIDYLKKTFISNFNINKAEFSSFYEKFCNVLIDDLLMRAGFEKTLMKAQEFMFYLDKTSDYLTYWVNLKKRSAIES